LIQNEKATHGFSLVKGKRKRDLTSRKKEIRPGMKGDFL